MFGGIIVNSVSKIERDLELRIKLNHQLHVNRINPSATGTSKIGNVIKRTFSYIVASQ